MDYATIFCVIFFFHNSYSINDLCNDEYASIVDCYVDMGVDIGDPPSYIVYSSHFFPVCNISKMEYLMNCYNEILDTCPYYRDNGPFIMDKDSFKAFLIGSCVNKHLFEEGMKCVGTMSYIINQYSRRYCISTQLEEQSVWDAYIMMGDWTWDKYCRLMTDGIECSVNRTIELGCSPYFYDFLRQSSYIRLPIECHKPNTSEFLWQQIYTEMPETLEPPEQLVSESSAVKGYFHHVAMIVLMCTVVF